MATTEDDNPFSKAQTVDPEVRAYVYSLVNALGGSSTDDDGHYVLGDDALACLRDLKRWLKLYDEKNNRLDVARCLAEAKLVGGDLIPILASWAEDGKDNKLKARVALACLEILVPLTWPLENEEMTVNHHRHTPYIQQAQVIYKAGILGCDTSKILRQVLRVALPSIAASRDQRTSRDESIIKLMLYFFRNVAVIQQVPNLPSQGLDSEVSRSTTIEAFRDQDVFALLLTFCSNMGEDFNTEDVILLDVLFNLIKGVDPRKLWMTQQERKGQGTTDLSAALAVEESKNKDAKRHQWSRHGRFGTMVWVKREGEKMSAVSGQDNLRNDQQAFFNMDKSKKWNKPQQKRKDIDHTIHDFDRTTRLTDSAAEKLRNFVEEFLDSGFNPFFTHLRRAIEREAERLLDVHYRQFFYTVAWFLEAERIRRETKKKEVNKTDKLRSDFTDDSYSLVAGVLNQETFKVINRFMQISLDNKEWRDLNACMRCFTQVLLTVQEMAQSPLEDDQEIADNIQNNIFYEETTHDRVVEILRGYKDQGFGYLDACTELSHVFLRMLERYSKENVDLQIRSRRRAKKKRKDENKQTVPSAEDPEAEEQDSEDEEVVDVVQVSKDRKFDFNRFAAKFSTQNSVNTFVSLLNLYRDLSMEQLKRAHRFFYRVAFKQDLAVLLYRVDIVALFYRMINGPDGLDRKNVMHKEWSEFSRQLFKKMLKKMEQRPELVVELLFSKINSTLYYLEYGQEKQTLASTRAPAELEIRSAPGRDLKEQIGIVVTVLVKDGKTELVRWIKEVLGKAFDERHAWEAEAEARRAAASEAAEKDNESLRGDYDVGKPSYITVRPASEDIKLAMFKNARLKLLMRLVGFELAGDEDVLGAHWIVPAALAAATLAEHKATVEQYEQTPWQGEHEDEDAEDMVRRARQQEKTRRDDDEDAPRDAFLDDSEGEEEFLFPDNPRKKRNKNPLDELKARRKRKRNENDEDEEEDDDLAAQRRAARAAAALDRRRKIKSEAYIRDSDDEDDDERDREFFEREEQVRQKQEANILKQMALGLSEQAPKANGKAKKKAKRAVPAVLDGGDDSGGDVVMADMDDDDDEDDDELDETASSQPRRQSNSEDSSDDEETPLSSQDLPDAGGKTALKEIPQARASLAVDSSTKLVAAASGDSDEDEEDVVPAARRRQQIRGGFLVDSDDDE